MLTVVHETLMNECQIKWTSPPGANTGVKQRESWTTTTWCSGMSSGGGRIVEAVVVAVVVVVIGMALLCYYTCPPLSLLIFLESSRHTGYIGKEAHRTNMNVCTEKMDGDTKCSVFFLSIFSFFGKNMDWERKRGQHNAHLISLANRDQVHYSCRVASSSCITVKPKKNLAFLHNRQHWWHTHKLQYRLESQFGCVNVFIFLLCIHTAVLSPVPSFFCRRKKEKYSCFFIVRSNNREKWGNHHKMKTLCRGNGNKIWWEDDGVVVVWCNDKMSCRVELRMS